ncbi:MAG: ribonucleotide-diphosphate reductase subunit beta [Candidatus Babeliales bacterium]
MNKIKGILGSATTDPNKILPMTYKEFRKHYKEGIANTWTPEEVSMQYDIEQWKSDSVLSKTERRLILWNLGFFSTAESLTANNIVLAVYAHVRNGEARQYLLRQAFEEAIHTDTFIYCCDSLGLDPNEIYTMYNTIPSIREKDEFVIKLTQSIFDPAFKIDSVQTVQQFIHDLIGYYVIMEGIFFYAGFAMMLALKRKGKMVGIGEQFEYIMRDESVHLAFGCDLINVIKRENQDTWTPAFQNDIVELIKQAVILEKKYAHDACPEGILGINAEQFSNYVEYIADRRLMRIGLPKIYETANPFPWMSQATDLHKEKNFFETKVTEYQKSSSLDWSDFA